MEIEPRPARAPKWSLSNKNLIENRWKSSPGQPGPQNCRLLNRIYLKINRNRAPASARSFQLAISSLNPLTSHWLRPLSSVLALAFGRPFGTSIYETFRLQVSYVKAWIAIFHTGFVPALCQQVLKVKTALAAASLSAFQTCLMMRPAQGYFLLVVGVRFCPDLFAQLVMSNASQVL